MDRERERWDGYADVYKGKIISSNENWTELKNILLSEVAQER